MVRLKVRRLRSGRPPHPAARQHLAQSGRAATADAGFAQKDVGEDPDPRQNDHDHHPGHPRGRFTVRPQNGPRDEGKVHQDYKPVQIAAAIEFSLLVSRNLAQFRG